MPKPLPNPGGEETANQLISLAEAAERYGLSAGHLRLLANQQKIWAVKIGRNWVTTAAAIEAYLATDRRPGPKTSDQTD